METQKTSNSQSNLEKEEWNWCYAFKGQVWDFPGGSDYKESKYKQETQV